MHGMRHAVEKSSPHCTTRTVACPNGKTHSCLSSTSTPPNVLKGNGMCVLVYRWYLSESVVYPTPVLRDLTAPSPSTPRHGK